MSHPRPCLFVGGGRDGEHLWLESVPNLYVTPVRQHGRWSLERATYDTTCAADEVYARVELEDAAGFHVVYVHNSINPGNVVRHLLDGYKNSEEPR